MGAPGVPYPQPLPRARGRGASRPHSPPSRTGEGLGAGDFLKPRPLPMIPEVETTARGLRERVLGRTIVAIVSLDWPRMAPNATLDMLASKAVGRMIEAVT